jgi:hypothetical protein
MSLRHLALVLLIGGLPPLARADVLTIDDDGPADFSALQPAIDAALPGDVLLVAPGDYAGFVVDGKGLSILASVPGAPGQRPVFHSGIIVRHLPAGQTLLLEGLRADTPVFTAADADALRIEDCAGSVRVAHSALHGFPVPGAVGPAPAGLSAWSSPDVVVTDSVLTGAAGGILDPVSPPGGTGLLVVDSQVTVWNGTLLGGFGGGSDSAFVVSGDGGPAVHVVSGRAVIEGGYVSGGFGPFGHINASAGGPALLVDAGAEAWVRGADLYGGAGGYVWLGGGPQQGPDGPVMAGDGAAITLPGEPAPFALVSPTAVEPGGLVRLGGSGGGLLLVGLQGSNQLLPAWTAPLHVGGASTLLALPGLPVQFTVPALPAGFGEQVLHLQLVATTHELSAPVVLVLAEALP